MKVFEGKWSAALRVCVMGFLLLVLAAIILPYNFRVPNLGLMPDATMLSALNQAIVQGLQFGKEIIFTFGPYSSILSGLYNPGTIGFVLAAAIYLSLAYFATLLVALKNISSASVLGAILLMLSMSAFVAWLYHAYSMVHMDAFSHALSLWIVVAVYRYLKDGEEPWAACCLIFAIPALGLLPLIKGSFLPMCIVVMALTSMVFVHRRCYFLAAFVLLLPCLSLLLFWHAAGQSWQNFPYYFEYMLQLISGFAGAMSHEAGGVGLLAAYGYVFSALALFIMLLMNFKQRGYLECVVLLAYALYLCVCFKAGFVRHDGHELIAVVALLVGILTIPMLVPVSRWFVLPVVAAWLFVFVIEHNTLPLTYYMDATYLGLMRTDDLVATFTDFYHDPHMASRYFYKQRLLVKSCFALPKMSGSFDMYSPNQGILIASGNRWQPRPVFQSYAAYTPKLLQINRKHLLAGKAPDHILFALEPIDHRVPSLADGASWPVLMGQYNYIKQIGKFALLNRKAAMASNKKDYLLQYSPEKTYRLGEEIELPQLTQPVFAKINLRQTWLGRVVSLFYKPTNMQMVFYFADGEKTTYRFIPSMAKTGFLVSPLIESTAQFVQLYHDKSPLYKKRSVSRFALQMSDGTSHSCIWNDSYRVSFSIDAKR